MKIISIKSTNLEFTTTIREAITKKLLALERFTVRLGPVVELQVEVGKTTTHHRKGDIFHAEATLHLPGARLRAEKDAETLYAAIDAARDELARQIKKYKERRRTRVASGARRAKEMI